jgi:hypothetical protein
MAPTGEMLVLGFWPPVSVDASRQSVPLPDKSAPVILTRQNIRKIIHHNLQDQGRS